MEGDLYRDNLEAIRKLASLNKVQQNALILYLIMFVRNDGKRDAMLTSSELRLFLENGRIKPVDLRKTLAAVDKRAFGNQATEGLKESHDL